jgi:hypothetical protein
MCKCTSSSSSSWKQLRGGSWPTPATSCLPPNRREDPWRLSAATRAPLLPFSLPGALSLSVSIPRTCLQGLSSAAIHRRCSAPPSTSPTSPDAAPRCPLPPHKVNRPGVPGIAAARRRSLTGPDRRRLKLLAAGLYSGQADLAVELKGEPRSSWTPSPPSCWSEPSPESRPAICRHGPSCPAPGQAGLPCGPQAPAVSSLGSIWPGCKKFLQLVFISRILDFA